MVRSAVYVWGMVLVLSACGDPSSLQAEDASLEEVEETQQDSGEVDASDESDTLVEAEDPEDVNALEDSDETPDGAVEGNGDLDTSEEDSQDDVNGEDVDPADAEPEDTGPEVVEAECAPDEDFDYACSSSDDSTCPDGVCLFGQCLAPVVDPERWATCGDGVCTTCEVDGVCPADCEPWPDPPQRIRWNPETTITIQVPGFRTVRAGDVDSTVYGQARSPGGIGREMRPFMDALGLPDGMQTPDAPNQVVGVQYYGGDPAPWIPGPDIYRIEQFDRDSPDALHRYALVVALFVRQRMQETGAENVRFVCHSMGCHILRYVIEHDLEGLASDDLIVRWVTVAGVLGGARLARLYDNPVVRSVGGEIGLNTADFVHMHPDWVADVSARWDHRLHEANNPNFAGIVMHHILGTDPRLSQTANIIRLLDLNNPGDEPNDGIVYTLDQFFERQDERVQPLDDSGRPQPSSRSALYLEHFDVSDAQASGIIASAGLFHHRRVRVRAREATVHDDLERRSSLDFSRTGESPGELVAEVRIRYPWVESIIGANPIVHESRVDHRLPEIRLVRTGATLDLDLTLFEGPVFDDMTSMWMDLDFVEVDCYPRFDIDEWCLPPSPSRFVRFTGDVPLEDHTFIVENDRLKVEVHVEVLHFSP